MEATGDSELQTVVWRNREAWAAARMAEALVVAAATVVAVAEGRARGRWVIPELLVDSAVVAVVAEPGVAAAMVASADSAALTAALAVGHISPALAAVAAVPAWVERYLPELAQ